MVGCLSDIGYRQGQLVCPTPETAEAKIGNQLFWAGNNVTITFNVIILPLMSISWLMSKVSQPWMFRKSVPCRLVEDHYCLNPPKDPPNTLETPQDSTTMTIWLVVIGHFLPWTSNLDNRQYSAQYDVWLSNGDRFGSFVMKETLHHGFEVLPQAYSFLVLALNMVLLISLPCIK